MRGRSSAALLLLVAAIAACDNPRAIILCHNANCDGSLDTAHDDTMEALRRSLALSYAGRPVLDGVEVDLFWHGAAGRCLFAHDLNHDIDTEFTEPADEIAAYLAGAADAAYNGERFYLEIELKPHVGPSSTDYHSEAQLAQHAGCALDFASRVEQGARDGGHALQVIFVSFEPKLLRAVTADPSWPGKDPSPELQYRLSASFGVVPPLGPDNRKLSDYGANAGLDLVEFHPAWTSAAAVEAFRSMGLGLTLWMFDLTGETLDGIRRYEPERVVTSEAEMLRRWMD